MLGAAWQRCRVHFDVLARVPKGSAEMVAAAIRTIFAQPDAAAVGDQLDSIAAKLGRQFPVVEAMLRGAATDICAFVAFPTAHWKKIWSTNPLERVNKEIPVLRWVHRLGSSASYGRRPDRGLTRKRSRRLHARGLSFA